MTQAFAAYLQAGSYTAKQDRQLQGAQMLRKQVSGAPIQPISGVIPAKGTGNLLVSSVSLMTVVVEAGCAMIDDYTAVVDGSTNLTIEPSTSTARRDLVILQILDTEQGDAESKAQLAVVKGTTTADPTIPSRAIILAQVDVGANVTTVAGAIVDRRSYTSSAGGVVWAKSASGAAANVPAGTIIYDYDDDKLYRVKTGNAVVELAEVVPAPEMTHQRSGSQTLPVGWSKLTWSSIEWQSSTVTGELGSNTNGIQAVKGGRYVCEGSFTWPSGTTGARRAIGIGHTGSATPSGPSAYWAPVSASTQTIHIVQTQSFTAGQFITVFAYFDGSASVVADGTLFRLNVRKLP